eukprot:12125318-Heterocapsa_arctica.AAC.1
MLKPPPRKQRRWGASQGSNSGNSNYAMTPNVVWSVVIGTTGNGNSASVAVQYEQRSQPHGEVFVQDPGRD